MTDKEIGKIAFNKFGLQECDEDYTYFVLGYKEAIKKQFAITDVVASVLCVSDDTDCLNITKGKKYTLIESDNVFFRVVNDLGNEQLYYNYRFKRL